MMHRKRFTLYFRAQIAHFVPLPVCHVRCKLRGDGVQAHIVHWTLNLHLSLTFADMFLSSKELVDSRAAANVTYTISAHRQTCDHAHNAACSGNPAIRHANIKQWFSVWNTSMRSNFECSRLCWHLLALKHVIINVSHLIFANSEVIPDAEFRQNYQTIKLKISLQLKTTNN